MAHASLGKLCLCGHSCNFRSQHFSRILLLRMGSKGQNGTSSPQKTAHSCFNQQQMAWQQSCESYQPQGSARGIIIRWLMHPKTHQTFKWNIGLQQQSSLPAAHLPAVRDARNRCKLIVHVVPVHGCVGRVLASCFENHLLD